MMGIFLILFYRFIKEQIRTQHKLYCDEI
ncbi:MAG: hypothetical protein ACI8RD_007419, partial [Bacillariaceae sp.]